MAKKTYYVVSDGWSESGWISAKTLADLRRKSKRPIRVVRTKTV